MNLIVVGSDGFQFVSIEGNSKLTVTESSSFSGTPLKLELVVSCLKILDALSHA